MFTLGKPMSSGSAEKYYEGDYYTKDSQEPGVWYGKGAEELGLKGDIDPIAFKNLLMGKDPSGNQMIDLKKSDFLDDGQRIRSSQDGTFSAPKSLSILYEIALAHKNHELASSIISSFDKAVNKTLDFVEREFATTREQNDGKRINVKTQNLIIAKHRHDTSRSADGMISPQIHTHALIINATQKEDGTYKSLEMGCKPTKGFFFPCALKFA